MAWLVLVLASAIVPASPGAVADPFSRYHGQLQAEGQIARWSWWNSLPPRQPQLDRAIGQVYGARQVPIPVTSQNVGQMMTLIGAQPAEAPFVVERMHDLDRVCMAGHAVDAQIACTNAALARGDIQGMMRCIGYR